MLNAKSNQFNVKIVTADGSSRQRDKIRRRQDAWEVGEMVAHHGPGCDLWSAFVRLRLNPCRTGGESIELDPRSRTEEKTTAGFSFCREQSLPRAVAASH